ncbi:MAG: DUF721 domain-containing protein [Rhodobacteraceae bacterium]|jgi:hypothetical protein|nr:DUF721 domain-containing protein [Paracoccaceae bacterium]
MTRRRTTDAAPDARLERRTRGFERAAALVDAPIRQAGEARGFATARLLTHWTEIVGPELARICRPVKVSWSQGGFGGTLVVQADGAHAPLVQMQADQIRARVNACHGHAAIARLRIQQAPLTGFAEGQAAFVGPPARPATPPSPAVTERLAGIADPDLRAQLALMATHVRHIP